MAQAMEEISRLTDEELVFRLKRLVQADRALSAKLLVHIGELDERRLFLGRGYSSTFDYCRSGLGMSEAEAYLRILAARVGRRFPLVVARLAAGAVHLTAIKLLSPHLSEDNDVQLLDLVRGRTKRQIEVLLADLFPKPDVPTSMRKVREPRVSARQAPSSTLATATPQVAIADSPATSTVSRAEPASAITQGVSANSLAAHGASSSAPAGAQIVVTDLLAAQQGPGSVAASVAVQGTTTDCASSAAVVPPMAAAPALSFTLESPRPRATCTPLGLGRFRLGLMLGQEAYDHLEQLKELLRHQNPSGDVVSIVERALRELFERTMKRRFAKIDGPARRSCRKPDVKAKRKGKAKRSRYIPHAVVREVHARDAGQCTFVSPDGRRCTERGFIQVHHHDTTFARDGEATVENLRLACRAHNGFWADQDYGKSFMTKKRLEAATRSGR
jgi:hypothetical protein